MARKCFEVISLKFIFSSYNATEQSKKEFVNVRLNKYLRKYSSNTKLKSCLAYAYYGDIMVDVELSKKISLNTVINIFGQMYADTGYELSIKYGEIKKIVTVSVLC